MFMHILKFVGLLFIMAMITRYMPYGVWISAGIYLCGLWKLTDD